MNGISSRPYCLRKHLCGTDLPQGSLATRSLHGNSNPGGLPGPAACGQR